MGCGQPNPTANKPGNRRGIRQHVGYVKYARSRCAEGPGVGSAQCRSEGGGPRQRVRGSVAGLAELAELHEHARTLEEEVLSLRRRLQDAPKRVRTLEERLLETKGQLSPGRVPEREAHLHAAGGARPHRGPPRGGRQAHPAAVRVRHAARPQRRRHRRRVHRRPQGARGRAPRARRRAARSGAPRSSSTSRSTSCCRAAPTSPARSSRSRSASTATGCSSWAGPTRSGWWSCSTSCATCKLRNGDTVLLDPRSGLVLEKLPAARGGGPRPRGGARHRLRGHRRPRRPDRDDRRRGRAAVPPPGPLRRAPAAGARRASSSTARPVAARR